MLFVILWMVQDGSGNIQMRFTNSEVRGVLLGASGCSQVFAWIILLYILQLKLHPAIEIMGLLVSFIWIAKQGNTGKRDIWVLNIHECADHIPAPQRTSPFVFECHPRENLHYREVCKNSYISCLFCMRVYILDPGKRSLVDLVELNLHDDWANSSLWWGPWGAHDGLLKITRVSYLFSATLCALIWLVKTQTGWSVIIKVSSKKAKKPCETLLYP